MSKDTQIPFDISSIRTYTYDLSELDSVDEIKSRLTQTIKNIDFTTSKSPSNTENSHINTINVQLLQEIYKVQDSINNLSTLVKTNNSTALSILADKLVSTSAKTSETAVIESLFDQLLEQPDKMQSFIGFSKQIGIHQLLEHPDKIQSFIELSKQIELNE